MIVVQIGCRLGARPKPYKANQMFWAPCSRHCSISSTVGSRHLLSITRQALAITLKNSQLAAAWSWVQSEHPHKAARAAVLPLQVWGAPRIWIIACANPQLISKIGCSNVLQAKLPDSDKPKSGNGGQRSKTHPWLAHILDRAIPKKNWFPTHSGLCADVLRRNHTHVWQTPSIFGAFRGEANNKKPY